jgi:hypothetical protein
MSYTGKRRRDIDCAYIYTRQVYWVAASIRGASKSGKGCGRGSKGDRGSSRGSKGKSRARGELLDYL